MKHYTILFILFFRSLVSLDYPPTPEIPEVHEYPGCQIVDPYTWLENDADQAVEQWEEEQNALTAHYLHKNPELHALISCFNTIKVKKDYTYQVDNTPFQIHVQHKQDEEQPVYYLQKEENGPKIEFLNPNKMGKHIRIESLEFSPDGRYAAYVVTKGGNERPKIHLIDVKTLEPIVEPLVGHLHNNLAWNPNSKGFFYTAYPHDEYYFHQTVYYHRIGSDQDKLIFTDPEKIAWFYNLYCSDETLTITRTTWNRKGLDITECYTLPLYNINAQPKLKWKEEPDKPVKTAYEFDFRTYYLTNEDAPNFKIVQKTLFGTTEFIPESEHLIVDFCQVGDFFAVTYLCHGHTQIKIFNRRGKFMHKVPLPAFGNAFIDMSKTEETELLFESLIHPPGLYTYNASRNELTFTYSQFTDIIKTEEMEIDLHFTTSKDGTKIPLYVAHRKNMPLDGNRAALIRGYGGFNVPMEPGFYPHFIPWLEAGGVIAIPCLRGGGEYGQKWHLEGMRDKKQNTFDDCIAAAEWLIANGYTNPSRLAIRGESNGGLLVGAVITQRPDLFKAAVSVVALLDMLRFPLYPLGGLWTGEYGSPQNAHDFPFLAGYSPYHYPLDGNAAYPSILFYAGKNDLRVHPMHMRKMAARMQNALPDGNPILYYCDSSSGHTHSSSFSRLQSNIKIFGFLMHEVGLKPPQPAPPSRFLAPRKKDPRKGAQFLKLLKKQRKIHQIFT